ncbi:MAG: HK97 gp10 family phage protein [Eubacteriales bacterium]|nr:HK97 gp10 family phage protein [Eubacteriales bacterium]
MRTSIDFDGFEALADKLGEMSPELLQNAVIGLKKGLKPIERDAKKLCPVDTGELRSSIRSTVQEYSTLAIGKVGTPKKYGVYVEMGTGEVGRKSGGDGSGKHVSYRTGAWFVPLPRGEVMMGDTIVEDGSAGFMTRGQPARPYLYPAFKANKKRVLAAIRREVMKGVQGDG